MKKLIGLGLYGITLFGISAGVGWYLKNQAADEAALAAAAEQASADNDTGLEATSPTDIKPVDAFGDPAIEEPAGTDQQMAVAVRPAPMTVEEIVRYGLGLKERDRVIQEREEALQRQERRHQSVLADLQGEQQEIEGLLIQARDQRIATETLLKQVIAKKQEIDAAKQKAPTPTEAATENMTGASNAPANLKAGSDLLQGLSPESAAIVLKEYANNGDMDKVVQLMSKIEERKAAQIIEAISDEKLMSEIISGITELKSPPKAPVRR